MKRKPPSISVIKQLFATSGNMCAFENCTNSLVDKDGNVLGQVCHIEAASLKGPRYNNQSDDEYRRSFENLVLFCSRHHKIVDNNPDKYPTDLLNNLKQSHLSKFASSDFSISDGEAEKIVQTINNNIINTETYIEDRDSIEASKNVNTGNVNTGGGDFKIGDIN